MGSKANQYHFLEDGFFRSLANGLSEMINSLCGRARHLYELATGENPFPDEPAASQLNPDGRLGHNHRGPPWGSAFLHPVAWMVGMEPGANLTQPEPSTGGLGSEVRIIPADEDADILDWDVIVPWYDDLAPRAAAPYSRLFLDFVARLASGASASITIRAWSTEAVEAGRGMIREDDFTITSTSAQNHSSVGTDLWIDVLPGENRINIEIDNNDAAGDVHIIALSLCQAVKSSH